MGLSRITQYILGLLLWPTVLITFSLTAIIWLMQALRFVDFIINRGLSVGDFVYLTMLILPSLLTIILPVALLIAVVFTYHKLYSDSELVVMQASGLSRWRMARPVLVSGACVMLVTYAFTLYLLPSANRQFKDMREFLKDNYASVLLQEEVFNHPVDGMTVFIRERADTGKLKGVLVHDNRDPDTIVTMMADEATLLSTPSGPRFLLEDGIRQEKRGKRISWLNFDRYSVDISYYTEKKLDRQRDESELYVSEIFQAKSLKQPLSGKLTAELHQRLSWPWFSLLLSLCAVSILMGGSFSRRGMWKRLVVTGGISLALVVGFFGLVNMLVKLPMLVPVLYGYMMAIFAGSALMLGKYQWRMGR